MAKAIAFSFTRENLRNLKTLCLLTLLKQITRTADLTGQFIKYMALFRHHIEAQFCIINCEMRENIWEEGL